MSSDRWRGTEDEARADIDNYKGPMIRHLLSNDDGSFSIMSHINCNWCDYCGTQGDCRARENYTAVPYKPNPYEWEEKQNDLE